MSEILTIPASEIQPGDNDRTNFDINGIEELAASIHSHGLVQPITVRPLGGGKFQIVAGERRYRAMTLILKLQSIPCIIRNLNDEEASAIMLAENIGRKDLDPVDEANAYKKRADQFGWSPSDIAQKCGVSTDRVKKRLSLLSVRADILHLVKSRQFPVGHAEALSILDTNRQIIAARPLISGSQISLRVFRSIVAKLHAEQVQEQFQGFSLVFSDVALSESHNPQKAQLKIDETMPEMPKPACTDTTGSVILSYIRLLESMGEKEKAAVACTILFYLDKYHFTNIPLALTNEFSKG